MKKWRRPTRTRGARGGANSVLPTTNPSRGLTAALEKKTAGVKTSTDNTAKRAKTTYRESFGEKVRRAQVAAMRSKAAMWNAMRSVEVSLVWALVCCVMLVVPVFFALYMASKQWCNCTIAWLLSMIRIHPCIVDLGPGGSDWQFEHMDGANTTMHKNVAYVTCGVYDSYPDDC